MQRQYIKKTFSEGNPQGWFLCFPVVHLYYLTLNCNLTGGMALGLYQKAAQKLFTDTLFNWSSLSHAIQSLSHTDVYNICTKMIHSKLWNSNVQKCAMTFFGWSPPMKVSWRPLGTTSLSYTYRAKHNNCVVVSHKVCSDGHSIEYKGATPVSYSTNLRTKSLS